MSGGSVTEKKILIMGPHACGKSSMREMIFCGRRAIDTTSLSLTIDRAQSEVHFAGQSLLHLRFDEVGGQDSYFHAFQSKSEYFRDVAMLVFVCDLCVFDDRSEDRAANRDKAVQWFQQSWQQTLEYSPEAHVVLLCNKTDLVDPSSHNQVYHRACTMLTEGFPTDRPMLHYPTSMFDDTLLVAWAAIVKKLLAEPVSKLQALIEEWAQANPVDEIIVFFDTSSLLELARLSPQSGPSPCPPALRKTLTDYLVSCRDAKQTSAEVSLVDGRTSLVMLPFTNSTFVLMVARDTSPALTRMKAEAFRAWYIKRAAA